VPANSISCVKAKRSCMFMGVTEGLMMGEQLGPMRLHAWTEFRQGAVLFGTAFRRQIDATLSFNRFEPHPVLPVRTQKATNLPICQGSNQPRSNS
jgi:hypothetical protein